MQEHFGFTDAEMQKLTGKGVSVRDLFAWARDYAIGSRDEPVSYVNLFYFVDKNGDFTENTSKKPDILIAQTMFEKLSISQKIEISEYISDLEDGEF